MSVTVHRAAVVFSPRFAVLVNPPDPAVAARLRAGGGGARALEWVLDGMTTDDPLAGRQTLAGLMEGFRQAEPLRGDRPRTRTPGGRARGGRSRRRRPHHASPGPSPRTKAYDEAVSLASAVSGGRTRVADMVEGTTPPLRTLYEGAYGDAIRSAHLEGVDLLANFPVATLGFAYTRGDMNPGVARLVPFRERGHLRAYGSLSRTEALLFRLDPLAVHAHLIGIDHRLPPTSDARAARIALLERDGDPLAHPGAIPATQR